MARPTVKLSVGLFYAVEKPSIAAILAILVGLQLIYSSFPE
jgi:hypothetical protein